MRNVLIAIAVVLSAAALVAVGGGIYAITTVAREAIATWGAAQENEATQQGRTDRTGKITDTIKAIGEKLLGGAAMLAL